MDVLCKAFSEEPFRRLKYFNKLNYQFANILLNNFVKMPANKFLHLRILSCIIKFYPQVHYVTMKVCTDNIRYWWHTNRSWLMIHKYPNRLLMMIPIISLPFWRWWWYQLSVWLFEDDDTNYVVGDMQWRATPPF